jgi:hypothetical protein
MVKQGRFAFLRETTREERVTIVVTGMGTEGTSQRGVGIED